MLSEITKDLLGITGCGRDFSLAIASEVSGIRKNPLSVPDSAFFITVNFLKYMEATKSKFDVRVKRSSAGLGLYAFEPIKKGETIIEYVGHRLHPSHGDTLNNRYVFNVSTRVDIDGSPRWNTARYINHSCRPNCEAINRRGRIFIVSRRQITAGEELTYNYGKDYFEGILTKEGCLCVKCAD